MPTKRQIEVIQEMMVGYQNMANSIQQQSNNLNGQIENLAGRMEQFQVKARHNPDAQGCLPAYH